MLTVFIYHQVIIHHEYAPERSNYQQRILPDCSPLLQDAIRYKQPQVWQSSDWLIHHDITSAHVYATIQTLKSDYTSQKPLYMAPYDF